MVGRGRGQYAVRPIASRPAPGGWSPLRGRRLHPHRDRPRTRMPRWLADILPRGAPWRDPRGLAGLVGAGPHGAGAPPSSAPTRSPPAGCLIDGRSPSFIRLARATPSGTASGWCPRRIASSRPLFLAARGTRQTSASPALEPGCGRAGAGSSTSGARGALVEGVSANAETSAWPGRNSWWSTLSGGKPAEGSWLGAGWLAPAPRRVLIVDEPTRGIDVGAKVEVHKPALRDGGQAGIAIIAILVGNCPEVAGDQRIAIVHACAKGAGSPARIARAAATQEILMGDDDGAARAQAGRRSGDAELRLETRRGQNGGGSGAAEREARRRDGPRRPAGGVLARFRARLIFLRRP